MWTVLDAIYMLHIIKALDVLFSKEIVAFSKAVEYGVVHIE